MPLYYALLALLKFFRPIMCSFVCMIQGVENGAINHLAFSENGYHMASASSNGDVNVWDLRKLTKVDSFQIPPNGDENPVHIATCLSFCPWGKHLAFGTSHGQVYLCPVKDMTQAFYLSVSSNHEGRISGILWGVNAQSLITSNDHDRGIQFWGTQFKDP